MKERSMTLPVDPKEQQILNSISDVILSLDPEMKIRWANTAAGALTGGKAADIVGHRCYHILMKNLDVCDDCPLQRVLKTKKPQEGNIRSADDTVWRVRGYPVLSDDGEIEGIIEVRQDISSDVKHEEILKRASDEWRTTFDSISDMISIVDTGLTIIKGNNAFAASFGKLPRDLVGENYHDLLLQSIGTDITFPVDEIKATISPQVIDWYEPRIDTHFELSVSPIYKDNTEISGHVIIQKDVTHMKKREVMHLKASDEWRAGFDSLNDIICIIDDKLKILKVNEAFARYFDAKPKNLIGKSYDTLLRASGRKPLSLPYEDVVRYSRGKVLESYDDKTNTHFEITLTPIVERKKTSAALVHIQRDISQRIRSAGKIKEYSQHLEMMLSQLTKELHQAPEEMVKKTKLSVLRQMASGVGYELRHPLDRISRSISSLRKKLEGADDETVKNLDMISEEIRKAERVMLDLLYFSRAKTSEKQVVPIPDLVAIVLKRRPPPKNVRVTTKFPSGLPSAHASSTQVAQVLYNLLQNAYQSGSGDTQISVNIQAKALHDYLSISVADNGGGIPARNLAKIYDPLFTTRSRGMGIGLTIVKNLVEANGGTISVESKEKKGTTATFTLPILMDTGTE
ncbi:MAG: PAS domain-containing protein [Deltaproteobacteria bacterium]|nr:PAS domain-containing protein [Candidatus Zymogenaceae bacterium]